MYDDRMASASPFEDAWVEEEGMEGEDDFVDNAAIQAEADEQASLAMIAAMTRRRVPTNKLAQPEWDPEEDAALALITSTRRRQPTSKAAAAHAEAAASGSRSKTSGSRPVVPVRRKPGRPKGAKSKAKGSGPSGEYDPRASTRVRPAKPKPRALPTLAASRSRSTSVIPNRYEDEEDQQLYCVCKTSYNDEKAMIQCDKCDEWYHTPCVGLPDHVLELVDLFICPICVKRNPEKNLKTTHKQRCARGLRDRYPASAVACHKPARGAISKYCSDECGILSMQDRIDDWSRGGGNKNTLWDGVKGAEKREGVIISEDQSGGTMQNGDVKMEMLDEDGEALSEEARAKRQKVDREVARLQGLLDKVSKEREQLMDEMDVISWRERLTQVAIQRSQTISSCGWDQRLLFGKAEWIEAGAGVIESYEEGAGARMNGQPGMNDEEGVHGEWWCRGQKKCERHNGWQKLRSAEVELERELIDGALQKLTTRERQTRRRMEDIVPDNHHVLATSDSLVPAVNGLINGNETHEESGYY